MDNFSRPSRSEQAQEVALKRVCYRCIGEDYLANEVRSTGKRRTCSYCGVRRAAVLIQDLAESIESAFEQHYKRTPTEPDAFEYSYNREMGTDWFREGTSVVEAIADAAQVDEAVAADVQVVLADWCDDFERGKMGEESEFASDSHYAERPDTPEMWHREWRDFKRSLQTKTRFFNVQAEAHLQAVFNGLAELRTSTGDPVLVDFGPGTGCLSLFRARVFQSDDELETAMARPDLQLGPPPPERARAGRMNASGIPVFYGATDEGAALAEVRPPVGSKVAIAKFEIIRNLRLLNLSALESVAETGSIFDPTFAARLERAAFLRTLSELITRPVMPNEEAFEYLPTQAVADFLASKIQPQLDGMVYGSAQLGGRPPMAGSNSPTCGQSNSSGQDGVDYESCVVLTASREAASLSL
jgi:hypothetical protein